LLRLRHKPFVGRARLHQQSDNLAGSAEGTSGTGKDTKGREVKGARKGEGTKERGGKKRRERNIPALLFPTSSLAINNRPDRSLKS